MRGKVKAALLEMAQISQFNSRTADAHSSNMSQTLS